MGVPWQDAMLVGQLMGEKTILNEFVAYPHLGKLQDELTPNPSLWLPMYFVVLQISLQSVYRLGESVHLHLNANHNWQNSE
jgi:hypothetical protein